MSFEIKKATRQSFKPLIVLYALSGCGKTLSGLYLARGMAGETGKIVLADSESGRGSIYADVLPGGYDTLDLQPPFTPQRYIEAIDAIEQSGAAVGVIDSGSHEWEGIGGVNDMAAENEAKSGRSGLHNWRQPKVEHALFIQRLLRSSIPLIVCLRAKFKTRQTKGTEEMAEQGIISRNQIGKTVILKSETISPIQDADFIFEATCHMEVMPDHSLRLTKGGHPALAKCFPEQGPITIEHGKQIAAWCASAGAPTDTGLATLKKKLWTLTQSKHGGDRAKLQQWLIEEAMMDPDANLDSLTAQFLSVLLKKVEAKLK